MNSGAAEEWAFPVLDVTIDNNNSQRSYLTLCNQDLISPENLKGSAKISILFQHVNPMWLTNHLFLTTVTSLM
jgi:hypothetical protein